VANVAGHGRVDVSVIGARDRVEERRGRHDLAGLALPALDDFQIKPGLLHFGAVDRGPDPLNGGNCPRTNRTYGQKAGADRLAGQMDRASAALCDAAPELRTRQPQDVAQYPEKWHIGRDVDLSLFAIDGERGQLCYRLVVFPIGSDELTCCGII
jgi:hypothetical protein